MCRKPSRLLLVLGFVLFVVAAAPARGDEIPNLPKGTEVLEEERPVSRAIKPETPDGTWIAFYTCQSETPPNLLARLNELGSFWKTGDPSATAFLNASQKKLTITGKLKSIQKAEEILAELDIPLKQVKIDIRIVEVSYTSDLQFGFEFFFDKNLKDEGSALKQARSSFFPVAFNSAFPTANLTQGPSSIGTLIFRRLKTKTVLQNGVPTVIPWYSLDMAVAALKQNGKAKILSEPSITVAVGKTGTIKAVDNVPITSTLIGGTNGNTVTTSTIFKQIGITMTVTPVSIGEDVVYMTVNPSVEVQTGTSTVTSANVVVDNPIFSTRTVTTQLTVRDGETVIMGGLHSKSTLKNTSKVPILGDIPIIGQLFSSSTEVKKQTELIFMITPHIIDPKKPVRKLIDPADLPPGIPLPGE